MAKCIFLELIPIAMSYFEHQKAQLFIYIFDVLIF